MKDVEAAAHQAAKRLAPYVANGSVGYFEALDVATDRGMRTIESGSEYHAFLSRIDSTLARLLELMELTASAKIRLGIAPLIARRAKKAEIVGAAVRLGYHALPLADCEAIALEEISCALAKLKARR